MHESGTCKTPCSFTITALLPVLQTTSASTSQTAHDRSGSLVPSRGGCTAIRPGGVQQEQGGGDLLDRSPRSDDEALR